MDQDTASDTEYESEYLDRNESASHTTPRRTVYDERVGDDDVDDIETGVSIQIGPGGDRRSTNGMALPNGPMSADVDDILLVEHGGSDGDGFVAVTKGRVKRRTKSGQ